jgi:hypothetical protein
MALKATMRGGAAPDFPLTFNEIKNVGGLYERSGTGDVLVVSPDGTTFVPDKKVRTGYSRTGCLLIEKSTGTPRKLHCDKSPDGVAQWRKFAGALDLACR